MYAVEEEQKVTLKKKMASQNGFTGVSLLHKYLYPLYGFNVLKHLVIDVFHTIPLNLIKNLLNALVSNDLINIKEVDELLMKFPWTSELKNGRLPRKIKNDKKGLSSWKAEGYLKFGFPAMECILEDEIEDRNVYEVVSLAAKLVELHFYRGRSGWTDLLIEEHINLAKRINVLGEECFGIEFCTISIHNLLHLHEDIVEFGASDNYWCAVFERAVKKYIKRSNNAKGIEYTFAMAEGRRELLKSMELKDNSNVDFGNVSLYNVISSKQLAEQYVKTSGIINRCLLLGAKKLVQLDQNERNLLCNLYPGMTFDDTTLIVYENRSIFCPILDSNGSVLRVGEYVIAGRPEENESVFLIERCISIDVDDGNFEVLCKVKQYNFIRDNKSEKERNFWTGYGHISMVNHHDCYISAETICRKVMIFTVTGVNIVVDFMRKQEKLHYRVTTPCYVVKNDMVQIQGSSDLWYGEILDVNKKERKVSVNFYVNEKDNIYIREVPGRRSVNVVSWNSIVKVASGRWVAKHKWEMAE